MNNRTHPVNQLVAHGIEDGHLVLALTDLSQVIILYLTATGRPA